MALEKPTVVFKLLLCDWWLFEIYIFSLNRHKIF